jgi:hypothetical protein
MRAGRVEPRSIAVGADVVPAAMAGEWDIHFPDLSETAGAAAGSRGA